LSDVFNLATFIAKRDDHHRATVILAYGAPDGYLETLNALEAAGDVWTSTVTAF
jgi:hypothetical protein